MRQGGVRALVVGGVLAVELVVAVAIVKPGYAKLLLALGGVGALALVALVPFLAACLYLALTASILYSTFFSVHLGVNASAPEMLLGALLLVAVVNPRRHTWGGAAGGAIAVFLAVVIGASALAISAGRVDLHSCFDQGRSFWMLTFYYVIVRLFPEPRQVRRLLAVAIGLAAVSGVVALAVALGGSVNSFLQDSGRQTIYDQGFNGFLRVRLPGVALAYSLFWVAVAAVAVSRRRRFAWGLGLTGMVIGIVVSFNRNMWIGLILGLAVMIALGGTRIRYRLVLTLVVAAAGIFVLVLSGPDIAGPKSGLHPIVERGSTLLSPKAEANDPSLRDRGKETQQAWSVVKHHLVTGLGPGAQWGTFYQEDLGNGTFLRVPQVFLHNQYLYLVVAGGVFALAAFLGYLLVVLRTAWRWRTRDPALPALLVGVIMIMLSSIVMISFTDENFVATLALIGGAVAVLARPDEQRVAVPSPIVPARPLLAAPPR